MRLRQLMIKNFRGIRELKLDLDDTTVLIGENNFGKTAILEVLRLCLGDLTSRRRVVFDPFDFYLKDDATAPSSADPIQVTLTFSEAVSGEWDGTLIGRLGRQKILQVGADGRNLVVLRVTCSYSTSSRDLEQDWEFLTADGSPLTGLSDGALGGLQREISYFYLPALRDAARHFDAKGKFWRPFLKDNQLPEDKRALIEAKLREVNELVVASHTSFEAARARLRRVQEVVPMAAGDAVSIEAVPGRIFDMLSKAQIYLGSTTGAKVPIGRHGEGTQSLAVLMLFSAFLDAWPQGVPIIGIEEPEAHLHPSAIRALWKTVEGISGQKLISTHSGDILSEVPIKAVRRLSKSATGITVHRLEPATLSADDERKFNFHIRHARGELLFARCWLLVEGETELTLLPELARHLGIDLERAGVRCVQHRHVGIELFLKVARDLGIKCCALTDNDLQGLADQAHVRNYVPAAILGDALHVMAEPDIEHHLCALGFGPVYEAYLSPQTRPRVTAAPGDADYWPQVLAAIKKTVTKPEAALAVLSRVRAGNSPVPPVLERTLRDAVALAGAP